MTSTPTTTRRGSSGDLGTFVHVGWNIQHGWKLSDAIDQMRRFAQQHGAERPQLLTLQELQEGQADEVAGRFGLEPVEAPNVRPGSRNALFFAPELFEADPDWVAHAEEIRHRPATAKLTTIHPSTGARSRRQLAVASVHLDFGNPENRARQTRWVLANMYKDNRLIVVQGDMNSWTDWGAPSTLANVADRAFALDRSIILPDGTTRPDDMPHRIMAARGLVELGRYAATVLGQSGADRPTTWDGPKKHRQRISDADCPPGGLSAIDRAYVDPDLAEALVSATTPAEPQVQAVSDHLPQVTVWNMQRWWEVVDAEVEIINH
ncbi:endonuclease/exonuclease/phosphatase family protein [Kitasatospora sp. NPDC088783]|uniref:endonuclease/exonuclease/phosphatase family protein n=1 Tax=Kitasatospora sp. NPDC088783 TaxID=3364077 RepID=UPI0037FF3946